MVDNPSDQVVDIVAAGDTAAARTWAVVDIAVVVLAAHTQVVVDIVAVVPAGCMEPVHIVAAVYNLVAHTGLDMVVVALDIVQTALHLPGSWGPLSPSLLQAHCHILHRNAHLERPVVHSWCRSYSVAERSGCLLWVYLLLARAFHNFDKIFCQ